MIRRRSRIERLSVLLPLELLLHLSFIPRKAIATLACSIFLALNLIVFSWFSTLLLVLFLKLLNSYSFHLFLNLFNGSKLTNTFTKKLSQSPTIDCKPFCICIVFSISNQTLALVLLYHCHSQAPRSFLLTKITDRSFTHHAPVPGSALPKKFHLPFTMVN